MKNLTSPKQPFNIKAVVTASSDKVMVTSDADLRPTLFMLAEALGNLANEYADTSDPQGMIYRTLRDYLEFKQLHLGAGPFFWNENRLN